MICLGDQGISPSRIEAEAAQLRIQEWFRPDFMRRFPTGMVLSELEYMGRTTAAPMSPGPLVIPNNPQLSRILAAMTEDFRRWTRDRDYRKCDVLGLTATYGSGGLGELLEITTGRNAASAIQQMQDKLDTLRTTVNRTHNLQVEWRAADWRPPQMFYMLGANPRGEVRYVCYHPTVQLNAPRGIILYEIHSTSAQRIPVPVPLPREVTDKMREGLREQNRSPVATEQWARQFMRDHPLLGQMLRGLLVVVGAATLLAALILAFDPVPGDEVAAALAAMALINLALSNETTANTI